MTKKTPKKPQNASRADRSEASKKGRAKQPSRKTKGARPAKVSSVRPPEDMPESSKTNTGESSPLLSAALTDSGKPDPAGAGRREQSIEAKLRQLETQQQPEPPQAMETALQGDRMTADQVTLEQAPPPGIPDAVGSAFDVRRIAETWMRYSNAMAKMSPFVREIDMADAEFIAWSLQPIAPKLEQMLDSWIAQWGGLFGALAVVYAPHAIEVWNGRIKAGEMANAGESRERQNNPLQN